MQRQEQPISELLVTLVAGNLGQTDTKELLTEDKTPTALLLTAVHSVVAEINHAICAGRVDEGFCKVMMMRLADLELDETMSQDVRAAFARLVALYIQRQRLTRGAHIRMITYSVREINILLYRFRSLKRGPANVLEFAFAPEYDPRTDYVAEGFRLAGAL